MEYSTKLYSLTEEILKTIQASFYMEESTNDGAAECPPVMLNLAGRL